VTALCVAEALAPHNRYRLVLKLWRDGHTDVEIAQLTAMTTYTAARIRAALGLAPNRGESA
jgi:uncharacterized protein YerC